jgi:hypothetical protein
MRKWHANRIRYIMFLLLAWLGACQDKYAAAVTKLRQAMLTSQFKHQSFDRLAYVVDTFGPRLWGSKSLELAIEHLYQMAKDDGFDNVRL